MENKMNILQKINDYLKEQDKKCPKGEFWCTVQKKCVPVGSGKGGGPRKKYRTY